MLLARVNKPKVMQQTGISARLQTCLNISLAACYIHMRDVEVVVELEVEVEVEVDVEVEVVSNPAVTVKFSRKQKSRLPPESESRRSCIVGPQFNPLFLARNAAVSFTGQRLF